MCTYLETSLSQEGEMKGRNSVEGAKQDAISEKNMSQSATFLEFQK